MTEHPAQAVQLAAAIIFALALVHTFSTKFFERLAHTRPAHAGLWHLLGEVEVVFGFWAMVLVLVMALLLGPKQAADYVDSRNYTEPMFVFAIMVIAGSRAVLQAAGGSVETLARRLPLPGATGFYLLALSLLPLLGSFITEPAAMTLAALMLRDRIFASATLSVRAKYATLGVLFVNISIGGTLTPFAAPPVLMVAAAWNWDLAFMLATFGWKAALAVTVNAAGVTLLLRRELATLPPPTPAAESRRPLPAGVVLLHLALLGGVVAFAHHPAMFLGLLLLFLGIAGAYPGHQDRLILREGLLVAFFLAGLVVLGGQQQWWLEPLLTRMDAHEVFFGAIALTAFTDNAALTYLGSLVPGLSDEFKVALVAGAVTGGGLTVIANAPNPAGFTILRGQFADGAIHPLGLAAAAALPTAVAAAAFWFL
ncbi:MAG: putative Na+/H+ antiporter [Rubrivivax sp.]